MLSKPTSEFAVMDRHLLRYICDELWPAEDIPAAPSLSGNGDVATSPPVRQTIAEIDVPVVFIYGVIDLRFAT
jgi:hypothetical protein